MARTITVKIPSPLAARLSAAVRRRKTTQSALIREALEEHLQPGRPREPGSVLELASDIIGSVEGPADLSTNKRRLAGYGR
jgi:metal-responsive CopG/Arc/MetJ family transcriptional regulator